MSIKNKAYHALRRIKKAERSLEKRIAKSLRPPKQPRVTEGAYTHPWTLQDIGNPTIVDQLKKQHCCGCESCANACPKEAISMVEDTEGFFYPKVDHDACIDCGMCVKKCPVICKQPMNLKSDICYAAIAKDPDMRMRSSSGGLFTQFARYVFQNDGVVFGAAYATFNTVSHTWVDNEKDLDVLRRSKYVQSSTGSSYKQAKEFLDQGRFVLYSGCPCQIAGLYAFLEKDYENLLTVDLICHGVPSPGLFRRYLAEEYGDKDIKEVVFRDKTTFGWPASMNVYFESGEVHSDSFGSDPYCLMFSRCLAMRPFCSICKFSNSPRVADVSIGDWWGIDNFDRSLDDKRGTSLLIINNAKGQNAFDSIESSIERCVPFSIDDARPYNYTIDRTLKPNGARQRFFELLEYQSFSKSVRTSLNWHYDVGIYGLWYGENYGSILTYYGLRQVLREIGLSSVMITNPIASPGASTLEPFKFAERNGYPITRHRGFDKMRELNSVCDTFLLGSDQLWNPELSKPYRFTYFFDFVSPENKRIAYGTSFGKDDFQIEDTYHNISALELRKFDCISVRDDFSKSLLAEEYGGIDAVKVLDPALLCNPQHYHQLANSAEPIPLVDEALFDTGATSYIFAYILDPIQDTKQSLIELARICDMPILVALDYYPNEREKRQQLFSGSTEYNVFVMDTPSCEQWLNAIRNSAGVLTDSFHGTIFSYIFKRSFVSVPNVDRGFKRFDDLLGILELKGRMVETYVGNEKAIHSLIFGNPVDFGKSDKLLETQREASFEWLKTALLGPKRIEVDRAYERVESCESPDSDKWTWCNYNNCT